MADPEFKDYEAEKARERTRQERPAKADKDPEWNRKDHPDPLRASRKAGEGEPKDAEGQAERGHVDQIVTGDGETQTR